MAHPILPPLREEHSVPDVGEPGVWHSIAARELGDIAEGLDVPRNVQTMTSIPDVWAHCIFFEIALRDPDHPKHKAVVSEWRGLLALIALQPSFFYTLRGEVVSLNPAAGEASLFHRVVSRTKPQSLAMPGWNWNEIGLLYASRNEAEGLAGLLVPSILVCPPSSGSLPENVCPWEEHHRLMDPLEAGVYAPQHLKALDEYLNALDGALVAPGQPPNATRTAIRDRITEFRGVIGERVSGMTPHTVSGNPLPFAQPKCFGGFLGKCVVTVKLVGGGPSEVILRSRGKAGDGSPDALLLDGDMCGPNDAAGPRVWDAVRLGDYVRQHVSIADLQTMISHDGANFRILRPDDLFENRLVRVPGAKFLGHPESFREFLLPLKDTALAYLSPADLRTRLSMQSDSVGGKWTVSLRCDVGGKSHSIRRIYEAALGAQNSVQEVHNPNALALWPDFEIDSWTHYYVYFAGAPEARQFYPDRFFLAGVGATMPGGSDIEVGSTRRGIAKSAVYRIRRVPEAIICGLPDGSQRTFALLLFPAASRVPSAAAGAVVGIDFGTVSTNVYKRIPGRVEECLRFKERIRFPFAPDVCCRLEVEQEFFPARDISLPIQGILKQRGEVEGAPSDTPLIGEFVFFAINWDDTLANLRAGRLLTNVNWSDDHSRVLHFLSQVILETAAELVDDGVSLAGVDWRFSCPEAFHDLHRDACLSVATQAVDMIIQHRIGLVEILPDSHASALFFGGKHGAAFAHPLVIVDVGGSTSDISVWLGNRECWHSSVKLGGRNMLLAYLSEDPQVLEEMAPQATVQHEFQKLVANLGQLQHVRTRDPCNSAMTLREQAVACFIESDVFREGFSDRIHEVQGTGGVSQLLHLVEFAICGLIYYVGLVLRSLCNNGVLREGQELSIALAGRGNKLLVDSNDRARQEGMKRLLRAAASSRLVASDVHFDFSSMLKHEVALGLTVDGPRFDHASFGAPILGDAVQGPGSGAMNWSTSVTEIEQRSAEDWHIDKLANLDEFVGHYKQLLGREMSLDTTVGLNAACGTLARQIKEVARLDDASRMSRATQLEPPFVVGLRALVDDIVVRPIRIISADPEPRDQESVKLPVRSVNQDVPAQYHVFISFKNLLPDGSHTRDSVIAREVYDFLERNALSAFLSNVSLERLGVSEYKKAIDDALDVASVVVVVGTSREHLESRWVRYEWDSFSNDILSGFKPAGRIFAFIEGMRILDLPRSLRQAQTFLNEPGALDVLFNFISNALGNAPASQPAKRREEQRPLTPANSPVVQAEHDVYFVYDDSDRPYVADLAKELENYGISWTEKAAMGNPSAGAELLTKSSFVVFIDSGNANCSTMLQELDLARQIARPIVPVRIEYVRPRASDDPLRFVDAIQYIDGMDVPLSDVANQIARMTDIQAASNVPTVAK